MDRLETGGQYERGYAHTTLASSACSTRLPFHLLGWGRHWASLCVTRGLLLSHIPRREQEVPRM